MTPASTTQRRYASLDGMRGLAALVVVIYHCAMVSPALAATVLEQQPAEDWVRWLAYSPLHLLWAGPEAVCIFFVLSGFVLALPFLGTSAGPAWRSYYPQRLLRLYVPVAASLLFATVLFLAVDRTARPGSSWWIAGHDMQLTADVVLRDLLLLSGTSWLNSVLWSLRLEVIFSLILPLVLLLVIRAGRARLAMAAAMPVLIAAAALASITTISYLLMFGAGVLLAAERERLHALAARLPATAWAATVVGALMLLMAAWWPGVGTTFAAPALAAVGAVALVASALWCPPVERVCCAHAVRWLGCRSFSLYLVHEPIVVTLAILLDTRNAAVVLALALPLALATAAVFYRLVERPSHRLARWAGRRALRRPVRAAS